MIYPHDSKSSTPRTDEFRQLRRTTDEAAEFERTLERENAALRKALADLLADYQRGAESGDWGTWDFEGMPEVIAARSALAQNGGGL